MVRNAEISAFCVTSGRQTIRLFLIPVRATAAFGPQGLLRGGLVGRARVIRLGGYEEGEQTESDDGGEHVLVFQALGQNALA